MTTAEPPWFCPGHQLAEDPSQGPSGPARPAPPPLPAFVTVEDAKRWTHTVGDVELATAERWPSQPQRWIVVVGSRATQSAPLSLRVAVVDEGPSARVVASSDELAPRVQYSLLPSDYWPSFCACEENAESWEAAEVHEYGGLEFPVGLERGALLGVHTSSSEGYAGGGGTFDVLTLLRLEGARLVPVLEVPSGSYKLIAGDWTATEREHHEYTLSLSLRPLAGEPLRVQLGVEETGRPLLFEWNEPLRAFRCVP